MEWVEAKEDFKAEVKSAVLTAGSSVFSGDLSKPFVEAVYCFDSCGSTMDIAKALSNSGLAEKLNRFLLESPGEALSSKPSCSLVVSETQTAGRGRQSKSWHSASGEGLYFSLAIAPEISLENFSGLSILVGVSVCKALRRYGGEFGIKWPNDVVVLGSEAPASVKAAGILVETTVSSDKLESLQIGVGVNVANEQFPSELSASSLLLETKQIYEPSRVLATILQILQADLKAFVEDGFSRILSQWREHSVLLGCNIKASEASGKSFEGKVVDLAEDGALLIEPAPGAEPERFYSGKILDVRAGATEGKTVAQSLYNTLEEISDPVVAEEFRETIESGEQVDSALIEEGKENSQNLAGQLKDMKLGQKVKIGMLGNMTARALLIRDTNRLVRAAVLKNPRLSDNEVADFAKNANLDEQVIRAISSNKSWMKVYPVKVAITANPKSPVDISMKWIKHLKDKELRNLSRSKNIPSALGNQVRKLLEIRKKK